MKVNYYRAISALIEFRNRHHLIRTKKNEIVLNFLGNVQLKDDYDSSDVPDVTAIAAATNLPRTKIHPILFQSYIDLIESLYGKPHSVTELVHAIYIHSYDEYKNSKNKQFIEEESKKYFWGEFRLPVTPRLGETIRIDFLDNDIKYNHGVVTEVQHDIGPSSQRVVIYVHPSKNYYWMWDKLKREHIEYERWLQRLDREFQLK